ERRCRHRERLPAALTAASAGHLNCGVRALFSGASGTGKTLAARLLASVLGMDLYRVDFSAVVNKYIGETEKSLNQIFSRAEAPQRWVIWRLHLPAGHAVDEATVEELAERCALSGGQIRNAVLHAVLLALDDGGVITSAHVLAAVHREYRKAGAACPLPVPD